MKVFMIGDTHFGVHAAHNMKKWIDIQFDYFYKQLIPYLKENVKEGDILTHGGDLYDNRTSIPIYITNKVEQLLIDLGEILPVHLIVGNHDCWNKGNNSVNSPRLHRHLDNINIYDVATHTLEMNDKKIVLMPWVERKKDMIKEISDNPGDYLICHSDLNGCRMHLSSVAHRNKDKIEVDEFKRYKRVFSSHIHIRQIHKNFEFIGAPYQMDRNDYFDKKGLTILDIDTGETEFVENTVSPTFKKIKINDDSDIRDLENVDTKKHFIDLEIKNSVLIGKRKNRKLLEQLIGNKEFASIEYINDLVKEEKNETIVKDVKLEDLQFDDFDKTILDYTKNQEYEKEHIKKGVMGELKQLLNIHKKEY